VNLPSTRRPRPLIARLSAGLLAVLLAGPVLAGCGAEGTGDKGYIAGDGLITQVAPQDRDELGELRGETLEGDPVDVADHRGDVVVINVWWSGCPPCRAEADELAKAADTLADEDVVFLGINTRDFTESAPLAFQRRYDVGYPSIFDPDGETLLAFRGAVSPNAIPSTIVIDPKGRIAASVLGAVTSASTLVDLVQDAGGTARSS
jgi:thiol-disulfide isomerase/thioredoxin